jgi:hypothetical protein
MGNHGGAGRERTRIRGDRLIQACSPQDTARSSTMKRIGGSIFRERQRTAVLLSGGFASAQSPCARCERSIGCLSVRAEQTEVSMLQAVRRAG